MKICGIEIAGSEIRLVILDGEKCNFSLINVEPRKITLSDDTNQNEVKAFKETVFAYMRENGVQHIAIKQRNKKGGFSGGAVGFKIEGLIQLYNDCEVSLISPVGISACKKKYEISPPSELAKYQGEAFETAFKALP
ncbi:MAG: DUF3010 family protein [Spirochaetes bacterium]|nr:DUF3010 family protein [Spirochaetota bacterium]